MKSTDMAFAAANPKANQRLAITPYPASLNTVAARKAKMFITDSCL